MNRLTAQIIVDILNFEMQMPKDSVWIREQDRQIPNDLGLYIVVGQAYASPLTNVSFVATKTVNNKTVATQIGQSVMREVVQIDVQSRANIILQRLPEVMLSMQSVYAQQQQEKNNFKIFRNIESLVDTSGPEGGSMLYRYSISIVCHVWYRKEKPLNSPLGDYYDEFSTRIDDEDTIGTEKPVAEFDIPPTTPP